MALIFALPVVFNACFVKALLNFFQVKIPSASFSHQLRPHTHAVRPRIKPFLQIIIIGRCAAGGMMLVEG